MSADTLRRAAAIVRERGWTQGVYEADDGRVCAEGAIGLAAGLSSWDWTPVHKAFAFTIDRNRDPVLSVIDWNDAPGRTADEVVAALEAAAARLEATS